MNNEQWAKRIAANLVRGGYRATLHPIDRSDLDSFLIDMVHDARRRDRRTRLTTESAERLMAREGGAA